MAKYQFNQAVRIVPPGKKPVVFARGAHEVNSPDILNHAHFKKFLASKAITNYVEKKIETLKPPTRGVLAAKRPGQLPGPGGLLKQQADAKAKAAATDVSPEMEVGGDVETPDDSDVDESQDLTDEGALPEGEQDEESEEAEASEESDASEDKPSKKSKKSKGKKGKSK